MGEWWCYLYWDVANRRRYRFGMRRDQELSFGQIKFELPIRYPREDLPGSLEFMEEC